MRPQVPLQDRERKLASGDQPGNYRYGTPPYRYPFRFREKNLATLCLLLLSGVDGAGPLRRDAERAAGRARQTAMSTERTAPVAGSTVSARTAAACWPASSTVSELAPSPAR